MALALPALYAFIGGRGAQEKTIAELKGEFALDVVPTKHYGANSAWQQLSVLAYNVAGSFQLDTGAAPRRRSRKRTYTYVLRSMRTLRFTLVARAGRLARIGGRQVLRLTFNPATAALYTRLGQRLAAWSIFGLGYIVPGAVIRAWRRPVAPAGHHPRLTDEVLHGRPAPASALSVRTTIVPST